MTDTSAALNNRKEQVAMLFELFDLDGNGTVTLHELTQVMHASRKGPDTSRKHRKKILQLEAQVRQAVETNKKRGLHADLALKTGGKIEFDNDGEPSLDPTAFGNYVLATLGEITDEDFDAFVETSTKAVAAAKEETHGNSSKKVIWDVFQLLDNNRDGFVDLDELEVLLDIETKSDKKSMAKWRATLTQRLKEQEEMRTAAGKGGDKGADSDNDYSDLARTDTFANTVTLFDSAGNLRLALADFQHFMTEFTDGDIEKLKGIHANCVAALAAKHKQFLETMKVNEIMDAIVDDLLRERPRDVLAGIITSCERLQRVGVFPRKLYRRASHVSLRAASTEGSSEDAPEKM